MYPKMFKNPEFTFGILRYTGKWLQNLSNHKTICNFLFSIAWVFLYISVVYIAYLWLSISILEIVIAYSSKLPILDLFPYFLNQSTVACKAVAYKIVYFRTCFRKLTTIMGRFWSSKLVFDFVPKCNIIEIFTVHRM